jgi:universal stress protein F
VYKTILVPIDLADAEKGKAMIAIARAVGGSELRLILAYVAEEAPAFIQSQLPAGMAEKIQADARRSLEDIAKAAGIDADIEVRTGHATTAILAIAEEKDVDLIIVASHRPGLEDYLIGSTASRVVRHAKCPVLIDR